MQIYCITFPFLNNRVDLDLIGVKGCIRDERTRFRCQCFGLPTPKLVPGACWRNFSKLEWENRFFQNIAYNLADSLQSGLCN